MIRQARIVAAIVALSAARPSEAQSVGRALVIGISTYDKYKAAAQLRFAHADAQAFGDFVQSPQGGGFNVRLLQNQQASRSGIYQAISQLAGEVGKTDPVYVFFAGHSRADDRGVVYLMPFDADPAQPQVGGIRADEFMSEVLSRIKSQQVLFFIDACQSGALIPGVRARGTPAPNLSAVITQTWDSVRKTFPGITMGFLSARPGEASYEDSTLKHGVFTYYLLKGLAGEAHAGTGNKQFITAQEINEYLVAKVRAYTEKNFAEVQTPIVTPDFNGGLVLGIHAASRTDVERANAAYSEGRILAARGDTAGAVSRYIQVISLDPKFAAAYNTLGVTLRRSVPLDSSLKLYRRAAELDPGFATAFNNIGVVLGLKGDTAGQRRALMEAIRIQPSYPAAHNSLGVLFEKSGDIDAAIREYREAARGRDVSASRRLGLALLKIDDLPGAISALQAATLRSPTPPGALMELDSALKLKQGLDDTLALMRDSVRRVPASWHALTGLLHERAHLFRENYDSVASRVKQHPTEWASAAELAEASLTTGRYREADSLATYLLRRSEPELRFRIVLRAVRIASVLAQGQTNEANAQSRQLADVIVAQSGDFQLNWVFSGTKFYIRQAPELEAHRKWLLDLFNALERGKRADTLAYLPPPQPSVALTWNKCKGDVICPLRTVDLTSSHFDDMDGVFVVWRNRPDSATLRVGQGNIRRVLSAVRSDERLRDTPDDALFVTWAKVAPDLRDGVEKYVADSYKPLFGSRFPYRVPIVANLPAANRQDK